MRAHPGGWVSGSGALSPHCRAPTSLLASGPGGPPCVCNVTLEACHQQLSLECVTSAASSCLSVTAEVVVLGIGCCTCQGHTQLLPGHLPASSTAVHPSVESGPGELWRILKTWGNP